MAHDEAGAPCPDCRDKTVLLNLLFTLQSQLWGWFCEMEHSENITYRLWAKDAEIPVLTARAWFPAIYGPDARKDDEP